MESRRRGCGLEHGRKIREGIIRRNREREDTCEMVPVAPFRQRFLELSERGEMNSSELAIYMGWVYRPSETRLSVERRRPGSVKPNTALARRTLGIGCHRSHVRYDTALRLAHALGMDPHEAGV